MNNERIEVSNFDFKAFEEEAITRLKAGESLTGKEGILTPLIKQLLEASLEGELASHLVDCKEQSICNRRNGKSTKQVKTARGMFELETPRDREGSFEPEIVKKRQTVLNE